MKNAYELEEEFGRSGRCIKRRRSIGAIVPWAITAAAIALSGNGVGLPEAFWAFFRR